MILPMNCSRVIRWLVTLRWARDVVNECSCEEPDIINTNCHRTAPPEYEWYLQYEQSLQALQALQSLQALQALQALQYLLALQALQYLLALSFTSRWTTKSGYPPTSSTNATN